MSEILGGEASLDAVVLSSASMLFVKKKMVTRGLSSAGILPDTALQPKYAFD